MKQRTKKAKRVLAWMMACMLLCSTVDNSLLSMMSHAEEADSAATATSGFVVHRRMEPILCGHLTRKVECLPYPEGVR